MKGTEFEASAQFKPVALSLPFTTRMYFDWSIVSMDIVGFMYCDAAEQSWTISLKPTSITLGDV
jgi:hypothetical protein